jgi:hypothetical protein
VSVPVAPLAESVATRECARSMLAANSAAPPLAPVLPPADLISTLA